MSDLKRVRHRPICCQSSRSALSVQFSGEFCCDRSLGAYYTAVLYVQLTAVPVVEELKVGKWSKEVYYYDNRFLAPQYRGR